MVALFSCKNGTLVCSSNGNYWTCNYKATYEYDIFLQRFNFRFLVTSTYNWCIIPEANVWTFHSSSYTLQSSWRAPRNDTLSNTDSLFATLSKNPPNALRSSDSTLSQQKPSQRMILIREHAHYYAQIANWVLPPAKGILVSFQNVTFQEVGPYKRVENERAADLFSE